MSVDGHNCRIRREFGPSTYLAKENSVQSLTSVVQCEPTRPERYENNRLDIDTYFEDLRLMKEVFLKTQLSPAPQSLQDSRALSYTRSPTKGLTKHPIVATCHAGPVLYVTQNTSLFPGDTTECKCQINMDGDNSKNLGGRESCPMPASSRRLPASNHAHQGVICHALQGVELRQMDRDYTVDPFFEPDINSPASKSSSSSSHSPSPVRSQVASPFAAATLKPPPQLDSNFGSNPIPQLFGATNNPEYPLATPFDTTQCVLYPGGSIQDIDDCRTVPIRHTNDEIGYPEYLNPFNTRELNDLGSLLQLADEKKPENYVPMHNPEVHIELANHENSVEVCESSSYPTFLLNTPPNTLRDESSAHSHVSRPRKKTAPLPPVSQNGVHQTSNLAENFIVRSTCASVIECSASPSANQRASSVDLFREVEVSRKLETQSMIVKRQAPPLPLPDKRVIKGDPLDARMSYSELHEKLYTMNKRIGELERQARRLQLDITQAAKSNGNVSSLLKQWSSIIEHKDSLSKTQSELVLKLRRQELEDRHANLEHEFRQLWAKQDALKTDEERLRENYLMEELIKTVNERDELVGASDEPTESISAVEPSKLRKFMCLNTPKAKKKAKDSEEIKPRHSFGLFLKRAKTKQQSPANIVSKF